jgi:Ankyrin repeats (3 copies)
VSFYGDHGMVYRRRLVVIMYINVSILVNQNLQMPLLHIFSVDISLSLFSNFDDMMHFANLCCSNRELRGIVRSAKSSWLDAARRITGYDVVPFTARSVGFWYQLKLLLCPWLSLDTFLARKPGPLGEVGLACRNNDTLYLTAVGFNGRASVFSIPSKPQKNATWKKEKSVPGDKNSCRQYFEGDQYHMCSPIHASAIAIAEFYNEYAFPLGWNRNNNGIYIVSPRKSVLKYIRLDHMDIEMEYCICSAPCQMWVSVNQDIRYFGPRMDRKIIDNTYDIEKAVYWIKKGNHREAIDFVLRRGSIDQPTHIEKRTLLHIAVHECRLQAAREILDAKADPNAVDMSGTTPIITAAGLCDRDMIRLLVENKADPNFTVTLVPDYVHAQSGTALHFIGVFHDSQGDIISSVERDGRTIYSASSGATYDTLVECGCDPAILNAKGNKAERAA